MEARRDDFQQKLAWGLVEIQAYQWLSLSRKKIDVFGIVTNTSQWQFYTLDLANTVYNGRGHILYNT